MRGPRRTCRRGGSGGRACPVEPRGLGGLGHGGGFGAGGLGGRIGDGGRARFLDGVGRLLLLRLVGGRKEHEPGQDDQEAQRGRKNEILVLVVHERPPGSVATFESGWFNRWRPQRSSDFGRAAQCGHRTALWPNGPRGSRHRTGWAARRPGRDGRNPIVASVGWGYAARGRCAQPVLSWCNSPGRACASCSRIQFSVSAMGIGRAST